MRRTLGFLAILGWGLTSVHAQTPDPFVLPPPSQRPPQAPALGIPPTPAQPGVTMDILVRQGFEVKALERTSDKSTDFVVILQRSGEIRTCLMRINRDANRALRRESACF